MSPFGTLSDGTPVTITAITDGTVTAKILDYGAVLQSLTVPDRNGEPVDVVLGYDDPKDYEARSGRMGAVMGRYAGRIADAKFTLDGTEYNLTKNRGKHHIHGGEKGFDKRIWHIIGKSENSVTLGLHSDDGDEGYPGNLDVEVTYTVEDGSLSIGYRAVSDRDTVVNLTNHSYFNLGGSGTIEDHEVVLRSNAYLELDGEGIPSGRIIPVSDTVKDLRMPSIMGNSLLFGGFDDCYLLDPSTWFAKVYCGRSGITMTVSTDLPAVQFYTAEGLKDGTPGKDSRVYGKRSGLCLETQYCPDSPNHDNFPSCVLRRGEVFRSTTRFSFSR